MIHPCLIATIQCMERSNISPSMEAKQALKRLACVQGLNFFFYFFILYCLEVLIIITLFAAPKAEPIFIGHLLTFWVSF